MHVDGRSMNGAGINDDELIVVSRAEQPQPGHIVLAQVYGLAAWQTFDGQILLNWELLPEFASSAEAR